MPRHRKPLAVAELTGATRKHPERYRKQPPAVDAVFGAPPEHLTDSQRAVWHELEAYAPTGTWTGADRIAVELLSVLLDEFRTNYTGMRAAKFGLIVSCLGRLGLTPADRQKLGTEPTPAAENPFLRFAKKPR
jgi:hypothetical protein